MGYPTLLAESRAEEGGLTDNFVPLNRRKGDSLNVYESGR
jgi:hypothetical protein